MTITLAEANSIVEAAVAKAQQLSVHVSVAVCDERGHIVSLNRMDGAYVEVNRFSIGKAVVSAGTGLPSGEVTDYPDHSPVAEVVGQGVPAIRIQGGLPILRNGRIEGACGVDGASSSKEDEECARAGIASVMG